MNFEERWATTFEAIDERGEAVAAALDEYEVRTGVVLDEEELDAVTDYCVNGKFLEPTTM